MGSAYDGSNGTTSLEFRAGTSGIRGLSPISIDVYDGASLLETVNVGAGDPVTQVYALANGLNFTLGNGTAVFGDSANVDLFDSVGSVVYPDAAIDGIGDNHPGLQDGFSVSAGSFEVNGETINIAASDSINSVLAAINLSAAGVTATFNVADERVEMMHNTKGTGASITPGTYGNSGGTGDGFSNHGASRIIGAVEALNESLEGLFAGLGFGAVSGVESLRSSTRSSISEALMASEIEEGRYGLRALERERSPLEITDRVKLGRGLRNAARPLQALFGSVDERSGGQGLLGALHTILVQNRETLGLGNAGRNVGSLVDLFA